MRNKEGLRRTGCTATNNQNEAAEVLGHMTRKESLENSTHIVHTEGKTANKLLVEFK